MSNLKINSLKDMARGLESSVDGPADESLAETNNDDESDDDEQKKPVTKVGPHGKNDDAEEEEDDKEKKTEAKKKEKVKGAELVQQQSKLDSQDKEQMELEE
jgi:hypothetical protein